jgi:predicted transcriptional regulator
MAKDPMKTAVIGVETREQAKARIRATLAGTPQGAFISFPTFDLMWRILTPKRMEIIRAMTGAGPLSIREVARRVSRDVKAVHGDVQALIKAGLINKTEEGKIEFPYDRVHVDFEIKAA